VRSLEYARECARAARTRFTADCRGDGPLLSEVTGADAVWAGGRAVLPPANLLQHIGRTLTANGFYIDSDDGAVLEGADAALFVEDRVLLYTSRLDDPTPEALIEKTLIFAHEFGHAEQHEHFFEHTTGLGALLQPGNWGNAAAAIAQYSRKAREEAEADAFATELLCPALSCFSLWRAHEEWTIERIARELELPVGLVRAQLVEGLKEFVAAGAVLSTAPSSTATPSTLAPEPDDSFDVEVARLGNDAQRQAAEALGVPVLVNAGPGTGKTSTLVRRICFLLEPEPSTGEARAEACEILVLTFSNETAGELRGRVEAALGKEAAAQMTIATFHGFGMQLLHRYYREVGLSHEFAILDDAAKAELLSRALGRARYRTILNLSDPDATVAEAARHIGHLKNRLVTPDDLVALLTGWIPVDAEDAASKRAAEELCELYRTYEAAKPSVNEGGKWTRGYADFEDLILLPFRLLRDHPAVRAEVQARHRWILVDEYQDVGRAVASLLSVLCGPDNLPWVVGDKRQAIYHFLGAAPENVSRFADDFGALGAARTYPLHVNFRSSPGIVACANQLGALLEDGSPGDAVHPLWVAARRPRLADPDPAVSVVEANCDDAEHDSVIQQVRQWINAGVSADAIAVLARRNVDVRRIALGLRGEGFDVSSHGIVTAEGAGGDLCACIGAPDSPRWAMPRLAVALARGTGMSPTLLNAAVRRLLGTDEPTAWQSLTAEDNARISALCQSVMRVIDRAAELRYQADAWAFLCAVLFDESDYLRRLLEARTPEAIAALEEATAALTLAAGHRFSRPSMPPEESRLRFAADFRRMLTSGAPSAVVPIPRRGAVRVMTCHASKGLEFPYVIASGQSSTQRDEGAASAAIPGEIAPNEDRTGRRAMGKAAKAKASKPVYAWLPAELQPDADGERAQADSLLFVALTRAGQRAVISYAASANARPRSPRRYPVRLLGRWSRICAGAVPEPYVAAAAGADDVSLRHVWGGRYRTPWPATLLADDYCAIRNYVEQVLQLSPRAVPEPLYRVFFDRLRRALAEVVGLANESGAAVTPQEAEALFRKWWPETEHQTHPHAQLYWLLGLEVVRAFAGGFTPGGRARAARPMTALGGGVSISLLAYFEDYAGVPTAIGFRPESLARYSDDGAAIKWGRLDADKRRLPLALAAADNPATRTLILSAQDGKMYEYGINAPYLAKYVVKVTERWEALARETFVQRIQERQCADCGVRMCCPHWLGLLTSDETADLAGR
jgi:superfamily I DNA/RNA helicase